MQYLTIDEEGTLKQTIMKPSDDDRDCIDAGIYQVVRFNKETENFENLNPDNTWTVIETV